MKFVDEFRNRDLVKPLLRRLHERAATLRRPVAFMEVCGTHTMAMFRHGLRQLLPPQVRIVSGPGCPVCVTSQRDIDTAVGLADQPDCIVTSFGDMLKVPGTEASLGSRRASGRDVRVVYSILDALAIAASNPAQRVAHIAIGFETTAPTTAAALVRARREKISNFFIHSVHKLVPPALHALLRNPRGRIDGFILPGHVSTIIGVRPYQTIARRYRTPCVITGFEATDMLQGLLMLIEQMQKKTARVETQYRRCVHPNGNPIARGLMNEVFVASDTEWRGLGILPKSGLALRRAYRSFDILREVEVVLPRPRPNACQCGEVLQGVILPAACSLFKKKCTPDKPLGPCMVSSEGTCAAYYRYGGIRD